MWRERNGLSIFFENCFPSFSSLLTTELPDSPQLFSTSVCKLAIYGLKVAIQIFSTDYGSIKFLWRQKLD